MTTMYTAIDTFACGYYLFYLTGEDAVSLEEESPKAMPIPRVVTVVKGGQNCTNRSESRLENRLENRLLNMPTGGGRKAGVGNYSKEEVMNFLGIMEGILPIGPDDWEHVRDLHSGTYPGRGIDSLRRKYNALKNKEIPTGDPTMPPEVRAAKRIKYIWVVLKCI